MTRYTTNTDAEGHYATELAQIAIEAATEAVENHIRRNGDRVPGPFTATIECDPGDEADRELSGPGEHPGLAASLSEVLDRSVPDRVEKHDDGWIRHDGGACPVHPMDVVETLFSDNSGGIDPASHLDWSISKFIPVYYRPLRDEDGVPYCSAEGLEDWAEYVATDDDESVWQYSYKPIKCDFHWDCGPPGRRNECNTPAMFANTRDHWTQTLRRVWHKGE